MTLIVQSWQKDDRRDAGTLARVASFDPKLLSSVTHPALQAQEDLPVFRARAGRSIQSRDNQHGMWSREDERNLAARIR